MAKPKISVDTIVSAMLPHMRLGTWNWEFVDRGMSVQGMAKIIAKALENEDENKEG